MSKSYKTILYENKHHDKVNPLQIFKLDEENKIILVEDEIENMLRNDVVKNRKVCVISVAGIFRQGKSFLLNFFLHFLKLKTHRTEKWINLHDKLTSGFLWKTTSERITEGILIWPEIFLTRTESDEEIAIILLDTQGTSDHTTSGTQSASLFALSVLISSVQIYNIKNHLNADHLKNLQMFTGYGSTYSNNSNEKPFQKLTILVRDWECPFEYQYGLEGGKKLLEKVFQKHSESKQEELSTIQKTIEENFDKVECFLMPHPGIEVATHQNFKGNFNRIDSEFLNSVQIFLETVLHPDNLVPKKINGQFVTVERLFELIKMYGNHFKEGKQVNVKTIYAATAEAYHQECLNKAVEEYSSRILKCDSSQKAELQKSKIVLDFVKKVSKMGTKAMIERCKRRLGETFDGVFEKHRTKFEENGLKSVCKKVFSFITGGATFGVAALEVTVVVTAVEVTTTAGNIFGAAVAGGIVGFTGGAILGGGLGLAAFGIGKCVIYLKNSQKTKTIFSDTAMKVKNVFKYSRDSVGTTFRKWVHSETDGVGNKSRGMGVDGDGSRLIADCEERVTKMESVGVNQGVEEVYVSGNAATGTEEVKECNDRNFQYTTPLVNSLLVIVLVALLAYYVTSILI